MADIFSFPNGEVWRHVRAQRGFVAPILGDRSGERMVGDHPAVDRMVAIATRRLKGEVTLEDLANQMPTALRGALEILLAEHDRRDETERTELAMVLNVLAMACARLERALTDVPLRI